MAGAPGQDRARAELAGSRIWVPISKPLSPPLWVLTRSASKRQLPASAALVWGRVGDTCTGSALSSLQRCFLSGPQLHSRAGPESFSPNGLHKTETTLKVQLM